MAIKQALQGKSFLKAAPSNVLIHHNNLEEVSMTPSNELPKFLADIHRNSWQARVRQLKRELSRKSTSPSFSSARRSSKRTKPRRYNSAQSS
ncbi:MAG: hypothetical protein ACFB5Z_10495 [Elainellaceae cyanobacterium]